MNDETYSDFLHRLANSNKSSETDSRIMESFLKKIGLFNARVVSGIVYVEGHGTIDTPPTDIHNFAKLILNLLSKIDGIEV